MISIFLLILTFLFFTPKNSSQKILKILKICVCVTVCVLDIFLTFLDLGIETVMAGYVALPKIEGEMSDGYQNMSTKISC